MFIFADKANEQDLYSGGEDRLVYHVRIPVMIHMKFPLGTPSCYNEEALQARIEELLPEDDDVIFDLTFN